jgi:hypothetical protein
MEVCSMKAWKIVALAVIAAVASAASPSASAAEGGKKAEAAAKARPAGKQLTGEIVSISAECIEIKGKAGEGKFAINAGTIFGSKKTPKQASDFKVGDKVRVGYKEDGDKKVATSIAPPPPAAKKK